MLGFFYRLSLLPNNSASETTDIFRYDTSIMDDIAVDWIYGHIYWNNHDHNMTKIQVSDMDGSNRKTLFETDDWTITSVCVDPREG